MNTFFKTYIQKGQVKEESIGLDQVVGHLERARKDLQVAKATMGIDSEASYTYAYLAMRP